MDNLTGSKSKYAGIITAVVIIILLVLLWPRIYAFFAKSNFTMSDEDYKDLIPDDDDLIKEIEKEHLSEKESDILTTLGYVGQQPWSEVAKNTELDESTFANHYDFVKNTRRYSSGANFTSVTDDNTNSAFTNYLGLRRPQHVPIGPTARQQPDIDQSVLQRNYELRWTDGPKFNL